ncbi:conjugative transposon protein TraM [Chondrinema litorale]|uniref:conjugative transposon protein TraM n=1 Tax=Chondrinema litorale TaxID=2994555 RepID=UPI0025436760|nr:conjugative transposon protein TraM [Chondrinema litorale]UZS00066.1 conjugative transposon protein TraM [Chondrinema litorale]
MKGLIIILILAVYPVGAKCQFNIVQASNNTEILVCINGNQEVKNGDKVNLRLDESIILNNHFLDRNTTFWGIVNIDSVDLNVNVFEIQQEKVNYYLYDLNAQVKGISLPFDDRYNNTYTSSVQDITSKKNVLGKLKFLGNSGQKTIDPISFTFYDNQKFLLK